MMHQPNFTKTLILLAFFLLGLLTLSNASPIDTPSTASLTASVPSELIHAKRSQISKRGIIWENWFCSPPANPFTCTISIPVCVTNPGDGSMCSLTYITSHNWNGQSWGWAALELFDNNCNKIGGAPIVPYSNLQAEPQGFALDSQLPFTVNIKVLGDASDPQGGNFNPLINYAGFGQQEPIVNLNWLQYDVESTNDHYNTIALAFKCH